MSKLRGRSIALEGPCLAGKTTLGCGLISELSGMTVAYVKDYSDHVGGGRFLPPPVPSSLSEEERTLGTFLLIEADRTKDIRTSVSDLVLIDRSVHTLLAHSHALELMTGVAYGTLALQVLTESRVPIWPDLVLYLDIPSHVVNNRNKGKFPLGSIFINSEFNLGLRSYFSNLAEVGQPTIAWLDGTLDPFEVRKLAQIHAQDLL